MTIQSGGSFQVSLERLDNDKGYIKENVVLCCLELNSSVKWSKELFLEWIRLKENDDNRHFLELPNVIFDNIKIPYKRGISRPVIDGKKICNTCGESKDVFHFKERHNSCKDCNKKEMKGRENTVKRRIRAILRNSKNNNNKRKNKGRNLEYNLTETFLMRLLEEQNGRCKYSDIPLDYSSGTIMIRNPWLISLERINPSIGYIESNVCFICLIFNSSDRTGMNKKYREEIEEDQLQKTEDIEDKSKEILGKNKDGNGNINIDENHIKIEEYEKLAWSKEKCDIIYDLIVKKYKESPNTTNLNSPEN
jgi:hypothetical protein